MNQEFEKKINLYEHMNLINKNKLNKYSLLKITRMYIIIIIIILFL